MFNELKDKNRNGEYPAFAYVMKITTRGGYLWTKIGMTTKTPDERAKGIKKDGVKGIKYSDVECKWFIPCKSKECAEKMENVFRSILTLIDPHSFAPHDRLLSYRDEYVTYFQMHPDVNRWMKEFGVTSWVDEWNNRH